MSLKREKDLEEALIEYVGLYGLTTKARRLVLARTRSVELSDEDKVGQPQNDADQERKGRLARPYR